MLCYTVICIAPLKEVYSEEHGSGVNLVLNRKGGSWWIRFEIWGSWIQCQKFPISSEKFSISQEIFSIFQPTNSDDLLFSHQLKKLVSSPQKMQKMSICTVYT